MAKTKDGSRGSNRPRTPPHPSAWRTPGRWRATTWAWILLGVAAAGLVAFVFLGGRQGEGGSETQPFVGGDLHSLVVDPSGGSRLYVGGHEGVALSTDGGATWRPIDSLQGADAMGWAFQGERVFVGGHPGLFVSTDGGRTFDMRNEGLPATDIHALGAGGGTIYAASPEVGVFASTDGGQSWEMRSSEAGQSFMGTIVVDPEDPEHLIAPDMQFGAVESPDGGRTWRALGGPGGAMWVSADPGRIDRLIVSGMEGAAASTDGGATWEPVEVPQGGTIVEMDPSQPDTLYAAGLEGTTAAVWVSRDAGATWSEAREA